MKRTLAAGLLVMLASAFVYGDDKVGESPYQPTAVGTTWTYKAADKKVVVKVVKHEKHGNTPCIKLDTLVDGNVVATEQVAVSKEGITRLSYNGEAPSKPILFLKLPPKADESWVVESKIANDLIKGKFTAGVAKIKVPAGEFDTVTSKGEFDVNGQPASFMYWISPGKGIVKLHMNAGGNTVELELEKFEEGQ